MVPGGWTIADNVIYPGAPDLIEYLGAVPLGSSGSNGSITPGPQEGIEVAGSRLESISNGDAPISPRVQASRRLDRSEAPPAADAVAVDAAGSSLGGIGSGDHLPIDATAGDESAGRFEAVIVPARYEYDQVSGTSSSLLCVD